jgi:hypothetical protein
MTNADSHSQNPNNAFTLLHALATTVKSFSFAQSQLLPNQLIHIELPVEVRLYLDWGQPNQVCHVYLVALSLSPGLLKRASSVSDGG